MVDLKPYPNAFAGTPFGDWLEIQLKNRELLMLYGTNEEWEEFLENEKCCQDPEYCVEAKCVECPNCQGFDTLRTTHPDSDNVSEFMCFECGEIFTAMNP